MMDSLTVCGLSAWHPAPCEGPLGPTREIQPQAGKHPIKHRITTYPSHATPEWNSPNYKQVFKILVYMYLQQHHSQ